MRRSITQSLVTILCAAMLVAGCNIKKSGTSKTLPIPGADTTPDQFLFADQANVPAGEEITSAAITISGIDAAAAVSVNGGTYSVNSGAFTAAPGALVNGDIVRVRHTSALVANTPTDTTLTVDSVTDTFTSTTAAPPGADVTPDQFNFTDRTNPPVAVNTLITSAPVTISGIDSPAIISVSGGTYSIGCTATYTSVSGAINDQDTVCVQHTSSSAAGGRVNTTLDVGGVTDTFTSTTAPAGSSGASLLPFLTGNGTLRLLDPRAPLVSNANPNPKTVDSGLMPSATGCSECFDSTDQATTFVTGAINGSTVSSVREARLVYVKRSPDNSTVPPTGNITGGPVFVLNLDVGNRSPSGQPPNMPTLTSSLTDVCRIIKSETTDYLNVDNSAVVLERAGADRDCGLPTDNIVTVIRLNTPATGARAGGANIPLVLDAGNPLHAQTNAAGAITGYVSFEATPTAPNAFSLMHRDANLGAAASLLPMDQTTGANLARTDLAHLFVTAIAAGQGLSLYSVNADGSGISPELYFFGSSPGNPIQGALHDATNLYFAHDNKILRIPLNGAAPAEVLTTVPATLEIVGNRALDGGRVVFDAHGLGGGPTLEAGVFSVPVTATNATATTLANWPDVGGGSANLVIATQGRAYINIINHDANGPVVEQALLIPSAGPFGSGTLVDGYWAGSSRATTFNLAEVSSAPTAYIFLASRVQNEAGRTDTFSVVNPATGGSSAVLGTIESVANDPAAQVHGFGPHAIGGVKRDGGFDADVYFFNVSGTGGPPSLSTLTPDGAGNDISLGN